MLTTHLLLFHWIVTLFLCPFVTPSPVQGRAVVCHCRQVLLPPHLVFRLAQSRALRLLVQLFHVHGAGPSFPGVRSEQFLTLLTRIFGLGSDISVNGASSTNL